jgi:hypothetical protein
MLLPRRCSWLAAAAEGLLVMALLAPGCDGDSGKESVSVQGAAAVAATTTEHAPMMERKPTTPPNTMLVLGVCSHCHQGDAPATPTLDSCHI